MNLDAEAHQRGPEIRWSLINSTVPPLVCHGSMSDPFSRTFTLHSRLAEILSKTAGRINYVLSLVVWSIATP